MAQRIALVTGGMGGLGEAICMKLEKMGITVVVTYSPGNTKYKDWLKEMQANGHNFRAYPCDVSDFDSCQKAVEQVTKEVGPIDISSNSLLSVEDCLFSNLANNGIFAHGAASVIHVKNSVFRNVASFAVLAEGGPVVNITNSQILSSNGVWAYATAASSTTVNVTDSTISGASFSAVYARAIVPGAEAKVYLTRTTIHHSGTALQSETANGNGAATIYVGGSMISESSNGWYIFNPGASIVSYGNNQFSGNAANVGAMTSNPLQ